MPLHGRLGIKVELGAGPSSAGWAGGRHPRPGLGVLPGQGAMLGHTCFPGHPGGWRPLPARPLLCPLSSLFPPLRLCRLPALSLWSSSPSPRSCLSQCHTSVLLCSPAPLPTTQTLSQTVVLLQRIRKVRITLIYVTEITYGLFLIK